MRTSSKGSPELKVWFRFCHQNNSKNNTNHPKARQDAPCSGCTALARCSESGGKVVGKYGSVGRRKYFYRELLHRTTDSHYNFEKCSLWKKNTKVNTLVLKKVHKRVFILPVLMQVLPREAHKGSLGAIPWGLLPLPMSTPQKMRFLFTVHTKHQFTLYCTMLCNPRFKCTMANSWFVETSHHSKGIWSLSSHVAKVMVNAPFLGRIWTSTISYLIIIRQLPDN